MIEEACSRSSTEEDLGCRVMSELDGLPANLPISFFSLIHDLGFFAYDRDELKSSVRRLAREGRILMSDVNDGIELSTPLLVTPDGGLVDDDRRDSRLWQTIFRDVRRRDDHLHLSAPPASSWPTSIHGP